MKIFNQNIDIMYRQHIYYSKIFASAIINITF